MTAVKKLTAELKRSLGKGCVFTREEYLETYAYDATGHWLAHRPDLVVFARDEQAVQSVLAAASRHKIPVTPRGAGVGYSGGSVPVQGGIVLVFTRMNRIINMDADNLIAEVEPGVVTFDLQCAAEEKGLFYPVDPASLKTSTIGGNVAENAGGPRCYKYGVTGNYVLSLDAFLMSGEKITTGSHTIKNVAGYNLNSLLVGSEGTLAVISKIVLRLLPVPEERILFRLDFKTLQAGAEFIRRVMREDISPAVLEFMDGSALSTVCRYLGIQLKGNPGTSILIEIDGSSDEVKYRANRLQALIRKSDVMLSMRAQTPEKQEELWILRRNLSPAVARLKPRKINEDIVVPIRRIAEAVDHINRIAEKHRLMIVLFGHLGDGNIHTNLMVDPDDTDEMERAQRALKDIFTFVANIRGTISGEHGIGLSKKPWMVLQYGDAEMALFKKIKSVFDPDNLLNPGKIW